MNFNKIKMNVKTIKRANKKVNLKLQKKQKI
jgi:hypothetical protein